MPKRLPDMSGPVGIVNDMLDSERVRELAAQHEIPEDYDLYDELTEAASWYHLMVVTKEKRLTHAKHKAYFEETRKRAKALEDVLKGMNAQLAYELHHAWSRPASKD